MWLTLRDFLKDLRYFEAFNLKIAPKKAYLGVRVIKFLGHRVTAIGVEPDPEKWKL